MDETQRTELFDGLRSVTEEYGTGRYGFTNSDWMRVQAQKDGAAQPEDIALVCLHQPVPHIIKRVRQSLRVYTRGRAAGGLAA